MAGVYCKTRLSKMNGGQALIESLYRNGVRVVFGIPGAGQYEATDAIHQHSGIRYINTRHEQAASFMADGYARASGEVGTALVVPGPGFYNACAGIATAHAVSSPILVITGSPYSSHSARDQEFDHAFLKPLTKWSGRADSPKEIPGLANSAFRHLNTGRRQPVVIEISADALKTEAEVELLEPETDAQPLADSKSLDQAALILADAEQPLIWAGGGAVYSDFAQALQTLAEHLQAPVVTTPGGKGAISDRHPLSLGLAELRYGPLNAWIDSSDVILAVGTGTSFGDRIERQQVIRIDIDEREIQRPNHHSLGIAGDASYCLEELFLRVVKISDSHPSRAEEVKYINDSRFNPADQLQPQHGFMQAIRAAVPDDGILVIGMNQMGYYSRNYYPTCAPRTLFTSSSHGTLGCAYPIALGAKVAKPDKAVVSISGDGGFLYNLQELATAVQYGIHAVAVVFNDNAFGNVLRAQIEQFNGHIIGTKLHNPDFIRLAEAFGARGIRAHNAEELESTLREALATEAPTLIEVPVGMMDRRY